jgi:RNA polymerase sigma-70 factor (ECF subfamily)
MTDRVHAALRAHADDLLGYLERRVEVRADAADLLSETLLTAWRRRGDVPEGETDQRLWLFGVARNVLANHHRSGRRRRALAGRLRERLASAEVADAAAGSEVRDAVRRLPEAQRELVMLVHWDGLTIAQAATVLGLNASTARGRYGAAREALRAALGDQVTV